MHKHRIKKNPLAAGLLAGIVVAVVAIVLYRSLDTPPPIAQPVTAVPASVEKSPVTPATRNRTTPPAASPCVVQGQVTDESGASIAGARILSGRADTAKLLTLLGGIAPAPPETAQTGPDGHFTVAVPEANADYEFRAVAKGYAPSSQTLREPEGGLNGLRFVLTAGGSLAGRVVDLDHQPMQKVIVQAAGGKRSTASAPTPITGVFTFDGLEAGDYALFAEVRPGVTSKNMRGSVLLNSGSPLRIKIAAGEQQTGIELVLPVRRTLTLAGHVYDEKGRPLAQAMVFAFSSGTAAAATAPTDSTGAFLFNCIPLTRQEGDEVLQVHCEREGYEPEVRPNVPVGTQDLRFDLRPWQRGTLTGVVLDAQTRAKITTAKVILGHVSGDWGSEDSDFAAQFAKGSPAVNWRGRFTLDDVKPGTVQITVYAPGYGIADRQATVRANETTDIEVLLEPCGKLRANVIYAGPMEGLEADSFQISCFPVGEEGSSAPIIPHLINLFKGEQPPEVRGTPAAVYEIELAPGEYTVVVDSSFLLPNVARGSHNFRTEHAQVATGQTTELEIKIGSTGVVEGLAPPGDPANRVKVLLVPGSNADVLDDYDSFYSMVAGLGTFSTANADKEGNYLINGIKPGTYTLIVRETSPDSVTITRASQVVQVAPEQTIHADFIQ